MGREGEEGWGEAREAGDGSGAARQHPSGAVTILNGRGTKSYVPYRRIEGIKGFN